MTSQELCHGVRTPLTVIANSANLLRYRLERMDAADGAEGVMDKVKGSLVEMHALVATILVEVVRADRRVLDTAWSLAQDPEAVYVEDAATMRPGRVPDAGVRITR